MTTYRAVPLFFLRIGTIVMLMMAATAAHALDVVTYYHTDALGTPVMESNVAGAVAYVREHKPYGEQVQGAAKNGPGFTGHVSDMDTGLVYMQARFYDPAAARFLSNDPVLANMASGRNYNRYWYANNNPLRYVDPSGRKPMDTQDQPLPDVQEKDEPKQTEPPPPPPPPPPVEPPAGQETKTVRSLTSNPEESKDEFIKKIASAVEALYKKTKAEYCGCITSTAIGAATAYSTDIQTNKAAAVCLVSGCADTPDDFHSHTKVGQAVPLTALDKQIHGAKGGNWVTAPGISGADAAHAPGILIQVGKGAYRYDAAGNLEKVK